MDCVGLDSTFDQIVHVLSSCDTTTSVAIQCSHPGGGKKTKKQSTFQLSQQTRLTKIYLNWVQSVFGLKRREQSPVGFGPRLSKGTLAMCLWCRPVRIRSHFLHCGNSWTLEELHNRPAAPSLIIWPAAAVLRTNCQTLRETSWR